MNRRIKPKSKQPATAIGLGGLAWIAPSTLRGLLAHERQTDVAFDRAYRRYIRDNSEIESTYQAICREKA